MLDWPTLGEYNINGRFSPADAPDTSIVSRNAASDGTADVFKNFSKVIKFRQLTSAFTSLSIDTDTYVIKSAKGLVDNKTFNQKWSVHGTKRRIL